LFTSSIFIFYRHIIALIGQKAMFTAFLEALRVEKSLRLLTFPIIYENMLTIILYKYSVPISGRPGCQQKRLKSLKERRFKPGKG